MQSLPQASSVTVESLLTHADWVRALARRLVADPNSAADVEQEVWREALESPPQDGSNPRGWLASVARNAARSLGRANTRRAARERGGAKGEALPPTSELVAEAELSRELAAEVLALEEPYRTVILLRFWRALSPEQIAEAQSIPRETVRTQLKRGLERLREQLDRRHGGREQWLAALAPLARETTLPLSSVAAGGVLALLLKSGAAAALAAGVWWAWPTRDEPASELAHVEEAVGEAPAKLETADSGAPARAPAESVTQAPTRATSTAAAGPIQRLGGAAIDLSGKPVVGLELEWHRKRGSDWPHWEGTRLVLRQTSVEMSARLRDLLRANHEEAERMIADVGDEPGFREVLLGITEPTPSARTGIDGRFEYSLTEGEWELALLDRQRTIVAQASSPREPDWMLVVAPCVDVAGVVVDEAGDPLAEARVSFSTGLHSLAGFSVPGVAFAEHQLDVVCGPDGRFVLDRVPLVPAHALSFWARGFNYEHVEVPPEGSTTLRVVLKRAREISQATISGLVLDQHGLPAPESFVYLGQDGGGTDAQGRFEFKLTVGHEGEPITATKRGWQAAVLENFGDNKLASRSDVLLRLGPKDLTITGRVLLRDGSAPKKGRVQVADGTPYGSNGCSVEDVTYGHYQPGAEILADGSFTLFGLREREYRLLAWSEDIGQLVYSSPIAAGSKDVLLRESAADFFERLEGRVLTYRGEPVERAELCLDMPIHRTRGFTRSQPFGRVRTDADGRFVLERVPRGWTTISLSGEGVKYASMPVPDSAERPLAITTRLQVRSTAEVADESIDQVQFLDSEGKVVSVHIHYPDSITQQFEIPRESGSFPVFEITDDAVTAVLRRGKTEIRRVPIEIRREKLLTLRF